MIVTKFGGTSLGTPDAVRRAVAIVRHAVPRRPVVVVSAHSGVTDALVDLAADAPAGRGDSTTVVDRHRQMIAALGLRPELCDPLFRELDELLRGLRWIGEATPRATDRLLGFGERCSAQIVAACLSAAGVAASAHHAGELGLRTDSEYGRARPLPHDGVLRRRLEAMTDVAVVTGFIGRDADGHDTTLGRNGSDYSATWIGEAIGAAEIQIWTDVPGVLTADPRIVPHARPIAEMRYDEAAELAAFGGKVLHPASLQPAVRGGIPVRVCRSSDPDDPGTLIGPDAADGAGAVRAVVARRPVTVVTVLRPDVVSRSAALAELSTLAVQHAVEIDAVVTSTVAATIVTGTTSPAFLAAVGELGEIDVLTDQAIVGVIGGRIEDCSAMSAAVSARLGRAGISVRGVGRCAGGASYSVIIPGGAADEAVRQLHDEFFARDPIAAGLPRQAASSPRGP